MSLGKFSNSGAAANQTVLQNTTITSRNLIQFSDELDAAKTGTLTTRTTATAGTLTMTTGHGITTAAKIDLYWDGGSRRSVVVGSVSVNSVPISGGSGDALPAASTAITAQVVNDVSDGWTFSGDAMTGLMVGAAVPFTVVFLGGADSEIAEFVQTDAAGGGYIWNTQMEAGHYTNPLSGSSVVKLRVTQGSTSAAVVNVMVLVD